MLNLKPPRHTPTLRIPLKKSNSQSRSEFSWPWTGFGEIHSGGYTIFIDRSQRPASSAREAIQHPRPQVRDKFENFGPDRFPTFSTVSANSGHSQTVRRTGQVRPEAEVSARLRTGCYPRQSGNSRLADIADDYAPEAWVMSGHT